MTSLDSRDYFNWCNQEITRYRNHEWQLALYSSAILGFITAWTTDDRKSRIIFHLGRWPPAIVIGAAVLFFLMAERHTRSRLRYYHDARERILRYSGLADNPFKGLSRGPKWHDGVYAFAFYFFIVVMGGIAITSIISRGGEVPRCGAIGVAATQPKASRAK